MQEVPHPLCDPHGSRRTGSTGVEIRCRSLGTSGKNHRKRSARRADWPGCATDPPAPRPAAHACNRPDRADAERKWKPVARGSSVPLLFHGRSRARRPVRGANRLFAPVLDALPW